jgi:hypothetical protein
MVWRVWEGDIAVANETFERGNSQFVTTGVLNEKKTLTMSFRGSERLSCSRCMHNVQMSDTESRATMQSKNDSFFKVCAWLSSSCLINEWQPGLFNSGALIAREDRGDADDLKRARTEEKGDVKEVAVTQGRASSAKCRRRWSVCMGKSSGVTCSW